MFTDRFIKIPTGVVDKQQKDLIGEDASEKSQVIVRLDPFEIAMYREDAFWDEETENEKTIIEMKSGSEVVADLSIDEFESLLNKMFNV